MQEDLTKQHQGGGETPQGENSTRLLQKEETSDSVPRERGISTHVRLTKPSSNISFPHKIMMQHTTHAQLCSASQQQYGEDQHSLRTKNEGKQLLFKTNIRRIPFRNQKRGISESTWLIYFCIRSMFSFCNSSFTKFRWKSVKIYCRNSDVFSSSMFIMGYNYVTSKDPRD